MLLSVASGNFEWKATRTLSELVSKKLRNFPFEMRCERSSKREGKRRAWPRYLRKSERNALRSSLEPCLKHLVPSEQILPPDVPLRAQQFRSRNGHHAHASSSALPARRDGWYSHTCAGRGRGQRHHCRRESRATYLHRYGCANVSAKHPEPLRRLQDGAAASGFAVCRAPSPRLYCLLGTIPGGTSPATKSTPRDETFLKLQCAAVMCEFGKGDV